MSKFNTKQEVASEVVYTKSDYDSLRENLSKFPQKKINGRLQPSWAQYMESINVLSIQPDGSWGVINPFQYTRYNNMRVKMEAYDRAKMDEIFSEFPEEKKAYLANLEPIFREIKDVIRRVNNSMKVTPG